MFLLDNNLSFRLVPGLLGAFPGSVHVRDLGMHRAEDSEIWTFARERGLSIVSKDDDFYQRSVLLGHPPKVVWLRLGNCSTARVLAALLAAMNDTREFLRDPEQSIMIITSRGSLRY